MKPLILASRSPRRRQLLTLLGLPFTVVTAEVDEGPLKGQDPATTARRLSRAKAQAVTALVAEGLVVAADTLVVLEGQILGKPADPAEATAMLRRLRGRRHLVLSGLTLLDARSGQEATELIETRVWMRPYSDEEIAVYVASGDPLDKAGAYAIQHAGFHPVARLRGCTANVMGLPLCRLDTMLRAFGVPLGTTPVQGCRPPHACAIVETVQPLPSQDSPYSMETE
ncbi:MAG: Maf family protein [Anaerolineae bacterium]